jgi:hypothetical protein
MQRRPVQDSPPGRTAGRRAWRVAGLAQPGARPALRRSSRRPPSRDAIHRHAVVHLAGVHHDHVASLGFDLTDYAPRPLRAGRHDPDAKLIMRMARKGMVGKQGHRLDARNSRSMLLHAMHPIDHDCPHVLRSAGFKAVWLKPWIPCRACIVGTSLAAVRSAHRTDLSTMATGSRRVLNRIAATSGFRSPRCSNAVRRQLAIEGVRERKRGSP